MRQVVSLIQIYHFSNLFDPVFSTSQSAIITNITNVTGHSPMQHSPLQLQPIVTTSSLFPKVQFIPKNGQLTVRANQLLPHSAPGLNTNPINIGNGKVILAQNNGNLSNNHQIIGDSLLTNSCLSGSPVNLQPSGTVPSPNFQNVQNLQNNSKGFQHLHNVQSLQTLKNIQNVQNFQKGSTFFNNGQNMTVGSLQKMPTFVQNLQNIQNGQNVQNIQNIQPGLTTTLTSTNNSNSLQMFAQQNQILQILQQQKIQCVRKGWSDCLNLVIFEVFESNFGRKNRFFKIAFYFRLVLLGNSEKSIFSPKISLPKPQK